MMDPVHFQTHGPAPFPKSPDSHSTRAILGLLWPPLKLLSQTGQTFLQPLQLYRTTPLDLLEQLDSLPEQLSPVSVVIDHRWQL